MDAKILYWTGALLNMGVIVGLAAWGIRARRQGDIRRHRLLMLGGIALVFGFIGSYALKLTFLGREDLGRWSTLDLWTLRIHELCVLTMVIAGGVASWRGTRLARTRNATHAPADPPAPPKLSSGHRAAGWTAVVAVILGFLTAGLVLVGMYRRAGVL